MTPQRRRGKSRCYAIGQECPGNAPEMHQIGRARLNHPAQPAICEGRSQPCAEAEFQVQ